MTAPFFFLSDLNYLKSVPRKNLSLSRDFSKPIINSHGSSHQCGEFALLFHYERKERGLDLLQHWQCLIQPEHMIKAGIYDFNCQRKQIVN